MQKENKILVVRLGALGDLVMTFNHFAYIRKLHPDSHITLLTRPDYVEFMRHCPYFDSIMSDNAPHSLNIPGMLATNRRIASKKYDLIYNLQLSSRSRRYLFMAGSKIITHLDIPTNFSTDKNWLRNADISKFDLPSSYVVIVAGCAPHRMEKRWHPANYGALCIEISNRGFVPVIIGTDSEKAIATEILQHCPTAISLVDQTDLLELAGILNKAKCVIGNDTGAIHMANYMQAMNTVLVSEYSKFLLDWDKKNFSYIYSKDLKDLSVDEVISRLPF